MELELVLKLLSIAQKIEEMSMHGLGMIVSNYNPRILEQNSCMKVFVLIEQFCFEVLVRNSIDVGG